MPNSWHLQLSETKERLYLQQKAGRRKNELEKRIRELERLVIQLEIKLENEQEDVNKLTRMSLTNLFHTLLRSKQEQLDLERQQAVAAALQLQEAQQMLESTRVDLRQVGEDLAHYRNAERDYEQFLARKESMLRDQPATSAKISEIEEQIGEQATLVRELQEALTAGKRVLSSLEDASTSLEKAEGWGKWDMWANGGLISTHLKHGHIDDAKQFILNANHLMHNFRDELSDLKRDIHIEIDISPLLKMADYWFDNIISDWVVQGRIKSAHEKLLDTISKVRAISAQLEHEHRVASSELQRLRNSRTTWIETTDLNA